jgi:hypothetical protein
MTVIHSTCRFQSGVTTVDVDGGASKEVVKDEYATSSERRTDSRAGRRSCDDDKCQDQMLNIKII